MNTMNPGVLLSLFAVSGAVASAPVGVHATVVSAVHDFAAEDFHAEAQRKLIALVEEGQPAAGENAWPLLSAHRQRILEIYEKARQIGPKWPSGTQASADMMGLGILGDPDAKPIEVEAGRVALAEMERAGLFEKISEIVAAPRLVHERQAGLLLNIGSAEIGAARDISRVNFARASLALEAGNNAEFVARIGEILALSTKVVHAPFLVGHLASQAIQFVALHAIRDAIAIGLLTERDLAALDALVAESPLLDFSKAFRGEQLVFEDAVDYVRVGGPAAMRQLFAPDYDDRPHPLVVLDRDKPALAPNAPLGPGLPDARTQLKLANEYYGELIRLSRLNAKQRLEAPVPDQLLAQRRNNEPLVRFTSGIDFAFQNFDKFKAERTGTRVLIAIERYRLKPGSYPDSLDALVPEFLPEASRDPFNDEALGYMGPKKGPFHGRHQFLLYAAGTDGEDNQGNVDFGDRFQLKPLRVKGFGLDFLLSDKEPRATGQ